MTVSLVSFSTDLSFQDESRLASRLLWIRPELSSMVHNQECNRRLVVDYYTKMRPYGSLIVDALMLLSTRWLLSSPS
jgi:hypothetical protein